MFLLQQLPPPPNDEPILLLATALVQIQNASAPSNAAITPLWPRQFPLAAAPVSHHCQPLSSHSCCCQPLLAFTAPIDGWLLHPSLLRCLLPASLSAAPIIDTFVAGRCAVLYLICAILFLIAPLLPLSTSFLVLFLEHSKYKTPVFGSILGTISVSSQMWQPFFMCMTVWSFFGIHSSTYLPWIAWPLEWWLAVHYLNPITNPTPL